MGSAKGHYHPLVVVLVAVAAGIVGDRYLAWPALFWWLAAAALLVGWFLLWRRGLSRAALVALCLALAATGGGWHHVRWNLFPADDLSRYASEKSQPAAIEAVALSAPRRVPAPPFNPMRAIPMGDRSRVAVEITAIRDGLTWRPVSGRALLTAEGHLLGVRAGDRLRIFAALAAPMPAPNPGEFDFAAYARGNRQLTTLRCDTPEGITVTQRGEFGWQRWLDAVRARGDELLWQNLDFDRLGLAEAVLLGNRELLDPEQNQAFLTTGTVHLLSISGLHVGILAGVLFWGLRLGLVPRGMALAIIPPVIWLYTLLAGAEPPAVRAAIMVSVGCLALYFGRRRLDFNTLAAAALVVLALNPVELFRIGSQLSFLSVACLIWLASRWETWHERDALDLLIARTRSWPLRLGYGLWDGMWKMTVVGLVIWSVTLPLVAANFHVVSPVGVVLNTLLAVPMAAAMAAGFGVLVLGWLFALLGAVCGWLCDAMLALLQGAVSAAAELPVGHFWVAGPAAWWVAGFYAGLAVLVVLGSRGPPRRLRVGLVAGWLGLAFAVSWLGGGASGRLECDFVSVGHGGAQLVRLPNGSTMLYDAGALGSPAAAARSISALLWSRGITHLDAVVISHADTDHYNALPDLLDRFSVGAVYVSPVMFRAETAALTALKDAIAAAGVPLRAISRADELEADEDCRITALHPPREGVAGRDNANSVVLALEYRGRRILLTGDLAPPGLAHVLARQPRAYDVLLVPHHGSPSSDPAAVAAWGSPSWGVISGSHFDEVEATRRAYSLVGTTVLNLATTGLVSVVVDGNRLTVDSWRLGRQVR